MKISYNWLKSYIPNIPEREEITRLVTFHICEIEGVDNLENGDTVYDLKTLPDRSHDLLSHFGVAKEIASLLGLKIKENYLHDVNEVISKDNSLEIEIETDNCRRYMGRIARGIKVGPSPEWMVRLLESIGQRSINNIVDATNYVMFDLGQPIHAFDLEQLSGPKIVVKNAKNDEKIDLVGSEKLTATLKDTDIVITDGVKDLAIAGVKGGLNSGITDNTRDILIEVANFDPVSVRKTARRLSILTDASKRYENDLSPTLCDLAMFEISGLISQMCPEATFEEVVDVYKETPEDKKVSFTTSYVEKMLGVKISDEEIEKILKNYNYEFSHQSGNWEVKVPQMRLDITGPHDFVEEIGRVYGYDKIVPILPEIIKDHPIDNVTWMKMCFAKQKLAEDGYREVMTYAFRDKGDVEILASASDKNFLRTNLEDGLSESISLNQKNLPLLGLDEIKVFEVGTVFKKKGEQINVAYGDKKKIKEVSLDEFCEEFLPKYSPDTLVQVLGASLPGAYRIISEEKAGESHEMEIFRSWSIYPFITRDIAVWVPEGTSPEKLLSIYRDFGTELLVGEPKLFDTFTKDEKTSYACRLVFQSKEKTLTDEEVNIIMENITNEILSLKYTVR